MKKRLFAIFIAVVMIATAINFAPVMEVMATGGNTSMNTKYSLYDEDGRWDAPQYYLNDGDYANTVASYEQQDHSTGVNKQDENFKTRHVTMFHECKDLYIAGGNTGSTTNRGTFVTTTQHEKLKTYYTNNGSSTEVSNVKGVDTNYPPYIVGYNGCTLIDVASGYARFASPEKSDVGGADCRMIFRNYYNTDSTKYDYPGESANSHTTKYSDAGEEGLDISQYDYLEFDLWVDSRSGYTRDRNVAPKGGARVYFYYETNDGSVGYIDNNAWCLDGYNGGHYNFLDQLNFDAAGNYQDFDKWVTVRIPLSNAVRFPSSGKAPTVKQITIRIIGGMKPNQNVFWIDDLRFVKNDDHEGVVYQGFNGYEATDYPSGKYFMINDFEYESETDDVKNGGRSNADGNPSGSAVYNSNSGVVRPFKSGSSYPEYERCIRGEDCNTDDRYNHANSSGNFNWAYKTAPSGIKNFYSATEGIVTQGNYGTVLKGTTGGTYGSNAAGWALPIYYQRHYATPMDLSGYTHFAIDIYLRYGIANNNTGATGVTFSIQLFKQYEITNGKLASGNDHDDYNFLDGYTIKFFLPYGRDCWDDSTKTDTSESYGKIIPLSTYQKSADGKTAYGGMRLIFTREDILRGTQTYYKYNGISGYPEGVRGETFGRYVLDQIDGMRFVWMNRASDANHQFDSFGNGYKDAVNLMLDNFIAYTPDTSVTIQNVTDSVDASLDEGQQFVYDIYGGYESSGNGYLNADELGNNTISNRITGTYDGVNDFITQSKTVTVSMGANQSKTIHNLPYNSYYISQQNWSWRYGVSNITCNKANVIKDYVAGNNTATILPKMSLDGSKKTNVSILDLMKQRHFTITFTQKRNEDQWLDANGNAVNTFN